MFEIVFVVAFVVGGTCPFVPVAFSIPIVKLENIPLGVAFVTCISIVLLDSYKIA